MAPARPEHERKHGSGQAHHAGHVDGHHAVPSLVVDVPQRQEVVHDPSDVGQDVHARSCGRHDPVDVFLPGDVRRHQLGGDPGALQEAVRFGEGGLDDVASDHASALLGEAQRGGPPDPAARAGHDRDPARVTGPIHRRLLIRSADTSAELRRSCHKPGGTEPPALSGSP